MNILRLFLIPILAMFLVFVSVSGVFAQKNKVTPSPSSSPTVAPVDSYQLFWPISAGLVMGEPLYFLKSLKENLREMLVFSDVKKADYNMILSEKRTVEAEKLFLDKKDYSNGKASLEAAQAKREKAVELLEKAQKSGRNVIDGRNRVISSFERQRALIAYLVFQVPGEPKAVLSENASKLDSLLSGLQ